MSMIAALISLTAVAGWVALLLADRRVFTSSSGERGHAPPAKAEATRRAA